MSKYFDGEEQFDMGIVEYKKEMYVDWKFQFKDLSDFHYVETFCGCTELGTIDYENNTISGKLNIDYAFNPKTQGDHEVVKNLYVKFNKDTPEFLAAENGKKTRNSEVTLVNLSLRALVRVP